MKRKIFELMLYPTYEKFYYDTYDEAKHHALVQVGFNGITSYCIIEFGEVKTMG